MLCSFFLNAFLLALADISLLALVQHKGAACTHIREILDEFCRKVYVLLAVMLGNCIVVFIILTALVRQSARILLKKIISMICILLIVLRLQREIVKM